MTLKDWMKEAAVETEKGKSLMQLSLETYLTEKLGFQLLEAKFIKNNYEDVFQFTVTNGENEYVFQNEYYEPKDFTPYQQILTLKEIRGKEGVLTTDHTLWLTRDNKKDKFLSTPLSELLSGKQHDQELRYVVDYLKNALEEVDGYRYEEKEENDLTSFVISLNDQIFIRKSFSNAIQWDFKKEKFSTIQLVFKEREKNELNTELDEFVQFAQAYLEKSITLEQHDVSSLYQFLKEVNVHPEIYTYCLLTPKKNESNPLFLPFVIETDDMFSYHQIEVSIDYLPDKKSFSLETNYLFRNFRTECASVQDIKREIEGLIELVNTMKQNAPNLK